MLGPWPESSLHMEVYLRLFNQQLRGGHSQGRHSSSRRLTCACASLSLRSCARAAMIKPTQKVFPLAAEKNFALGLTRTHAVDQTLTRASAKARKIKTLAVL